MRHGKKFNHLSRTAPHRKAMLANMASSLIISKRITTTVAKAKALRQYVEPLLTKSKEDTTHNRRIVFSYLKNKETIKELFGEVGAKIASRPGGYTRIIKLGSRLGDDAEMALIELVDYNENLLGEKSDKKKATTRRSRRGGKAKAEASDATEVKADQEKVEEPKEAPKKAKAKKEEPQASKSDSAADAEEKKIEDKKSDDSDDKKEDA
jgi:large subunit ribosomal protein L17